MLENIKAKLRNNEKSILGHYNMAKYAITIPLLNEPDSGLNVLFEVRANSLRRQPNEISFPGGKIESADITPKDAAVRETSEELGISTDYIEVVQEIDTYVHSQQTIIYPFVAYIKTAKLTPNKKEVNKVFLVPIDYLLKNEPLKYKVKLVRKPEDSFPFHLIPSGKDYPWRDNYTYEYFYLYNNHVIWGLTARILYNFISMIK